MIGRGLLLLIPNEQFLGAISVSTAEPRPVSRETIPIMRFRELLGVPPDGYERGNNFMRLCSGRLCWK